MKAFIKILEDEGVNVTVRRRLGSDVDASCGQLRRKMQKTEDKEKRSMKSFGLTDKGRSGRTIRTALFWKMRGKLPDRRPLRRYGRGESRRSCQPAVQQGFCHLYVHQAEFPGGRASVNYEEILEEACAEANGVAYEYSHFSEEFNGMGTTIVGGGLSPTGRVYYQCRRQPRLSHLPPRREHPPDHPRPFSGGGSGRGRRYHPGTGPHAPEQKCHHPALGSDPSYSAIILVQSAERRDAASLLGRPFQHRL